MSVIVSGGMAIRTTSSPNARIREAVNEVTRALEDATWDNLSTDWRNAGNDEDWNDRRLMLKRIRTYRRRNPLAKQAAVLAQHYVLGQGITVRAENKKTVAVLVDEFWSDPVNQSVLTSHKALKEFVDNLFVDGEQFIVMFPDRDAGTLQLGMLDPAFVMDVVTDPENHRIAKWYKVAKPNVKYNWKVGGYEAKTASRHTFYRDWRNDTETDAPPARMQEKGLVYHVTLNKRGKRGEPELAAAMDWLTAHKNFMEDRATLNRAAAMVAWKKKRKGGASDVAQEVARIRSTLTQTMSSYEGNPPPASGSTVVENEGSSLEWAKTDTGGQAATADERILRMMAGSGMGGIPNHYFGDEANANLATATAMELPLLKTYEDWQQLLRDTLSDIIDFMLAIAHEAGRVGDRDDSRKYAERVTTQQEVLDTDSVEQMAESMREAMREAFLPFQGDQAQAPAQGMKLVMVPKKAAASNVNIANDTVGPVSWYVDIDFPPIVQKDLTAYSAALKVLYDLLPSENIESQKMVVEMFLTALGANDVDQVMTRLFPPEMVAVLVPKAPPMMPPGMMRPQLPAGPKLIGPGQVQEGAVSLAEARVTRLLRIAAAVPSVGDDVAAAV